MVAIYYHNTSLQYELATSWNMDKVLISCSHFFLKQNAKGEIPKTAASRGKLSPKRSGGGRIRTWMSPGS